MSTNPEFSIQAFQAGDNRAFADVYNLHYARLLALTVFWINNEQAGEDIVQDTFVKLWIKRAEYNGLQHIEAFLRVTARNACLDYLKRQEVIRNNQAGIGQLLWREMTPGEKERSEMELLALRYHAEDASPEIKYYLDNDSSSEKAAGFFNLSARTLRRLAQKHISRLRQKLGLR